MRASRLTWVKLHRSHKPRTAMGDGGILDEPLLSVGPGIPWASVSDSVLPSGLRRTNYLTNRLARGERRI